MGKIVAGIGTSHVLSIGVAYDGDEEDEEMLGIEWALAEIRETYNHSKVVSASFTLANEDEVEEILNRIPRYFEDGHDAGVDRWRDFRKKLGTGERLIEDAET